MSPAVSLCERAYKVLEERSGCDSETEELLVPFANLLGTVPLAFIRPGGYSDPEPTLAKVLELVQEISEAVLGLRSGKRSTATEPGPRSKVESNSLTKRLRALKIGMDECNEKMKAQPTHPNMVVEAVLDKLQPVHASTYRSLPKCLDGTRVKIIADTSTWVAQGSATRQFLWIHGSAGVGKTCIAASICELLDLRNMLVSGFFCKWDNSGLREPREVIRSIVRGLAKCSNEYARLVVSAIPPTPVLQCLPVGVLYRCLLETPIAGATKPGLGLETMCVVVDGLDECGTETTRRMLLLCLYAMCQLVPQLKVVVTSRPDDIIRDFMSSLPEGAVDVIDLAEYGAEDDIRTFVHHQLSSSVPPHSRSDAQVVSSLVKSAHGVFLWADVACRFLQNGLGSWSDLASMFTHPAVAAASFNPPLDQLYFAVLAHATAKLGNDGLEVLKDWLGVVVTVGSHTTLPDSSILSLLDHDTSAYTLDMLLGPLCPIVRKQSSDDGRGVRYVICRSFFEYITTPARSRELCLDLALTHAKLSSFCLRTMISELRFNMCRLETSYRRNSDVPNLDFRVQAAINFDLSYSCQQWANHVAPVDSAHVDIGLLKTFLSGPSLLYWIEALSLLGRLDTAVSTLSRLIKWAWAQHSPNLTDVLELANDVHMFVSGYYQAISESTPHLYVTALALASNWHTIARLNRQLFPNTLRLAQGASQHWTSFSASPVLCTALSTSQTMAVSGSRDGSVRLWDAATGRMMPENCMSHSDSVLCVAFCPQDRLLASGSHDGTIHIQSAVTGQGTHRPLLGHAGPVLCLCFCAEGLQLASGSHDKSVRIWDTGTGTEAYAPLEGHMGPVLSIRFSPDNRSIVSASADKTARVWTIATGDSVALVGHTSWVQCVDFSSGGQHVVTGGYDRSVQVWDARTGESSCEPISNYPGPIHYVAFLGDEGCIASCSSNGLIQIWELTLGGGPAIARSDHSGRDLPVVYLGDGLYLASGTCVGTLRLWSGETGARASEPLVGHSHWVRSVAFSPDGRRIVSGSHDGTVRIWDAETGTPASEPLIGHSGGAMSVAFSPDGRRIVSGSDDMTVRLWDTKTGTLASEPLVGHSDWVVSVAFSPDGRRIVSGSADETVRLWDAETGTPASEPLVGHSGGVMSVAFSPDGRRIVSGSADETVRLWDAKTGTLASGPLVGHSDWVRCVAFSPDGRRIVSGSDDKTVRLWNAETGTPASEPLVGHSHWVRSVAFSPNGRRIVSGSDDKTVRLWDAETGAPASESLVGHSGGVRSVAFSPDGRRVVSGSADSTIRIWAADPNSLSLGLPANTAALSPFLQPDGWVSTPDQPRLFWLPKEHRRPETKTPDNSLICIGEPDRVTIDYSQFMHGTSWTLVAAESD